MKVKELIIDLLEFNPNQEIKFLVMEDDVVEITDADCYDVCVECEFLQRTGEIDR